MKAYLCTALLGLFLATSACAAPATPEDAATPQEDEVVAFVNVTVIPMDGERTLEGQTVVVRGERIVAVGPADSVEVPDDALTIDGSGKYLMPGLAEMHGHVPPPNRPAQETENVLFLYVANGITTVRGMLGADGQLDLRERANTGQVVSPTLYLAGPSFNGSSVNSPEEAVAKVRRQKAEGWNLLKIHPGLTMEEYDAMARTANEEGIRFGGHVPADVGLMHAIEMGQETFDHIDGYVEYLATVNEEAVDEEALAEAVRRTKEAGAWIVPTMALWETLYGTLSMDELRSYPELKYMPPATVEQWITNVERRQNSSQFDLEASRRVIAARMKVLEALSDGGALILMGTDAPQLFSVPGFSLHRELERMVDAGMTPYEIIESGTKNVGDYFANEDTFGIIAEGQRADMILVNANPLDDVGHIQQRSGVMVRGRWLSEEAIQQRLAEMAASYAPSEGSN